MLGWLLDISFMYLYFFSPCVGHHWPFHVVSCCSIRKAPRKDLEIEKQFQMSASGTSESLRRFLQFSLSCCDRLTPSLVILPFLTILLHVLSRVKSLDISSSTTASLICPTTTIV